MTATQYQAWQWDTGVAIPVDCSYIQAEARGQKTALQITAEDGVASLPDVLFTQAGEVKIFAMTDDGARVDELCKIKVLPRKKPDDYIYTADELSTWQELAERVDALEEAVENGGASGGTSGNGTTVDLSAYRTAAEQDEIDKVFLTEETDPTISDWAKSATKPAYTAAEVGADVSGAAAEVQSNLDAHAGDTDIHVTAAEKTAWNNYAEKNGIVSLEQTTTSTESGGTNIWTATLTDGSTYELAVKNGERGANGDDYTLTDTDKSDIAAIVLTLVTDGDEVSY